MTQYFYAGSVDSRFESDPFTIYGSFWQTIDDPPLAAKTMRSCWQDLTI